MYDNPIKNTNVANPTDGRIIDFDIFIFLNF